VDGVHRASLRLPGITQVRWSHYGPEFRDSLIYKEHDCKALTKEEKYEQALKKTQVIKWPQRRKQALCLQTQWLVSSPT
jgi:hypothetical protein